MLSLVVLKICDWSQEVSRVGQSVGSDGAKIRKLEVTFENLGDISSDGCLAFHGELDSSRYHDYLTGFHSKLTKLSCYVVDSLPRY